VTMAIDRMRCDSHGLCAELLPELIRLDDWGYPIIDPGPIPEELVPTPGARSRPARCSRSRC
jgi:ferredoxin